MKTAAIKTARAAARGGPKRKRATEKSVEPVIETVAPVDAVMVDVPAAEAAVAPVAEDLVSETVSANETVVAMASNCTVKDAAAIRRSLCEVADAAGQVVIDAGAVERVDTAVMQVLVAFVRDRLGRDREVTWRAPSIALLDSAHLLGVSDLLTLPNSAAASRAC